MKTNYWIKTTFGALVVLLSIQAQFYLHQEKKQQHRFADTGGKIVLKSEKATQIILIAPPSKQNSTEEEYGAKSEAPTNFFSDIKVLKFIAQKIKEGLPNFNLEG